MGVRTERLKRALYVGRVARKTGLLRVLRELGVWGGRPATREGAREFREALEQLGTTYIFVGAPGARARSALAGFRRLLLRVRARALSPLEDHSHARRALGAEICRVHAFDHDMGESRVGTET